MFCAAILKKYKVSTGTVVTDGQAKDMCCSKGINSGHTMTIGNREFRLCGGKGHTTEARPAVHFQRSEEIPNYSRGNTTAAGNTPIIRTRVVPTQEDQMIHLSVRRVFEIKGLTYTTSESKFIKVNNLDEFKVMANKVLAANPEVIAIVARDNNRTLLVNRNKAVVLKAGIKMVVKK